MMFRKLWIGNRSRVAEPNWAMPVFLLRRWRRPPDVALAQMPVGRLRTPRLAWIPPEGHATAAAPPCRWISIRLRHDRLRDTQTRLGIGARERSLQGEDSQGQLQNVAIT